MIKLALKKILRFINTDFPSTWLITGLLGMFAYMIHDGSRISPYMGIGFCSGFCSMIFVNSNEKASRLYQILVCCALIIGVGGFFLIELFEPGRMPNSIKWIFTFTGQLAGVMVIGMALHHEKGR